MGEGQLLKGGGYFNQINFFLLKKTIVKNKQFLQFLRCSYLTNMEK